MRKLKEEFKVLLINPPYPGKSDDPSLSLGYLGSTIKRYGAGVYVWDYEVESSYRDKFNEVIDLIKYLRPDFIGFTLTTPFVRFSYQLADSIKNKFGIPMVAGGTHATICPQEILERSAIEIAVMGEGEYVILDLIKYFRKEMELRDISGIAYKDVRGNIMFTETRPLIQNLDEIPFPLDPQLILKNNKGGIFGQIITSRGCPTGCIFCGSLVHGKQFRFRSAENIFEEMLYLYKRYSIRHFRFQDDALTINQPRLERLCDMIIDSYFRPSWACQSRADALGINLLKKMKEAGCIMIDIGLETASPRITEKIKKNISLKKVLETIENCSQIKVPLTLNMMAGFPFETKEDIKCNIDFMKMVSKKIARLNVGLVLRPYPGTQVYQMYHHIYGFTEWWLNDKFTPSIDTDHIPLYLSARLGVWTIPEDPTLEQDFFRYPTEIKKEIRKFVRYKCWFSMKKCHGIITSIVLLIIYYLSKYLYKIMPSMEKILMPRLFRLALRIHHLFTQLPKSRQMYLLTINGVKKYSRLFFRIMSLLFLKPDRFIKHLLNRILFIICIPIRGYAGWPLAFYISINSKCNFNCKTCDIGQRQTGSYLYKNMGLRDELNPSEWEIIINKIAYLKPYLEISAVEPLLYKNILEIIEFIKLTKRLKLSLTTNGFLLERYASDLTRLNVDRVNVSIDGPRDIHDEIRGTKGSFDASTRGIKTLLSYKKHPSLGINYTISNYNYAYLLDTLDYLTSLFQWDIFTFIHLSFITEEMAIIQNKKFSNYSATSGDISGVDLNKIDIDILTDQVKQIKQKYRNRNVVFHPDIPLNMIGSYYKNSSYFVLKKKCIFPWLSVSILCNGDVVAFNRCPTHSFGNLLNNEFKDIWNNKEFRKFRIYLRKEGAFFVCSRCGCLKIK